jgi:hypothetical protein
MDKLTVKRILMATEAETPVRIICRKEGIDFINISMKIISKHASIIEYEVYNIQCLFSGGFDIDFPPGNMITLEVTP